MKTDRIIEAGLAVTFLAFCGALYFSLHDNVVKVGDKAPEFSIKADNGKTITARDFGGKLLLLNFWATWCPPCISEVPALNQLQRALGPDGVVILGISEDEDAKAYKSFLARFHVDYLTARQPGKDIRLKYGTIQIP